MWRQRAGERFHTAQDGRQAWHDFSFGRHYDPHNTHFGLLLASNEELITAGGGFPWHTHSELEIVTWVFRGRLRHEDSLGTTTVLGPGEIAVTSAGDGIEHSETNDATCCPVALEASGGQHPDPAGGELSFIQMWIQPESSGGKPAFRTYDLNRMLTSGEPVLAVSGGGSRQAALPLRHRGAALWVARVPPGASAALPDGRFVHLRVVAGTVRCGPHWELAAGDSARMAGEDPGSLVAGETGAEVLIWQMEDDIAGA